MYEGVFYPTLGLGRNIVPFHRGLHEILFNVEGKVDNTTHKEDRQASDTISSMIPSVKLHLAQRVELKTKVSGSSLLDRARSRSRIRRKPRGSHKLGAMLAGWDLKDIVVDVGELPVT